MSRKSTRLAILGGALVLRPSCDPWSETAAALAAAGGDGGV